MSTLRSRHFIDTSSLFHPTIGTPMNILPANEPSLGLPSMPLLDRAAEQAAAMARRSVDAVRDTSQQLRNTAWRASDHTARMVRNEPLKSMLIAAVAGAALMALVGLLTRTRA